MPPICAEHTVLDLVPFGQTGTTHEFFALRLSHPGWPDWQPGQFVMLRPESFGLGLPLARPFSICHVTKQHLICFFKVTGAGTELMAHLKKGDKVTSWGPLGVGFALENAGPTLLLAGGMGIAPFVGYVNRHPHPWNMTMLFGHRYPVGCYPVDSINERIPVDALRESVPGDLDNFIYTMQEKIRDCAEQKGLVLACGPVPFLRAAKTFSAESGARLQVSLENRMACGVGACLGCVCKKANQNSGQDQADVFARVCLNGPVFWANDIGI